MVLKFAGKPKSWLAVGRANRKKTLCIALQLTEAKEKLTV